MAEILYRKWRPTTFAELAGQEHIATTLTNALASKRIAHAYLFAGPRGTGKTSSGRLLGRALNCTNLQNGEPCNQCQSCLDLLAGRAFDVIELDAASNRGIDEIRRLRDSVGVTTAGGAYKVYLIDEVHMLTEAAFNALLKTLEEPPPYVVFILATTDAHKVPATITSRCQRFDFRRAPLGATIANLQRICDGEGIRCEPEALELIAKSSTGSHRDAVNLLDQLATSYGNDLTAEHVRTGLGLIGDERSGRLARIAINADLAAGLELIASVRDDGLDLRQFQRELVAELRALLMIKSGLTALQAGVTDERMGEMQATVADVPASRLLVALRAFGEADLKADPNSTLPLDIALADCALDTAQPVIAAAETAPAGAPARTSAPPSRPAAATPAPVRQAPARPAPSYSSPPAPAPAPRAPEPQAPEPVAPVAETPPPAQSAPVIDSPSVTAASSGQPVAANLNAARALMRNIADAARAKSVPLGALLNSGCDIIEVDESTLVFGFKFPFHAEKMRSGPNLAVLSEVVSGVMNRKISVNCVHSADVTDWKLREPASRSSLVRAAQEMGARVISSGPEEQA